MNKLKLTKSDLSEAGEIIGCSPAAVFAVVMVESGSRGFIKGTDIPIIKWEGHYFSRLTNRIFDQSHPILSHRRWTEKFTLKNLLERHEQRLQKAVSLENGRWRNEALMSCSWGRFQIMGENWKYTGAKSLQQFINWMYFSEKYHLKAFIGFVQSKKIDRHMRTPDFSKFARVYNGRSYKLHNYDGKMRYFYNNYERLVDKYFEE